MVVHHGNDDMKENDSQPLQIVSFSTIPRRSHYVFGDWPFNISLFTRHYAQDFG